MVSHPHWKVQHTIDNMNTLIEKIRVALIERVPKDFSDVIVIRVKIEGHKVDLVFRLRTPHIERMECQDIYYQNEDVCMWRVMGRISNDYEAVNGRVIWLSKTKLLSQQQVCDMRYGREEQGNQKDMTHTDIKHILLFFFISSD